MKNSLDGHGLHLCLVLVVLPDYEPRGDGGEEEAHQPTAHPWDDGAGYGTYPG